MSILPILCVCLKRDYMGLIHHSMCFTNRLRKSINTVNFVHPINVKETSESSALWPFRSMDLEGRPSVAPLRTDTGH